VRLLGDAAGSARNTSPPWPPPFAKPATLAGLFRHVAIKRAGLPPGLPALPGLGCLAWLAHHTRWWTYIVRSAEDRGNGILGAVLYPLLYGACNVLLLPAVCWPSARALFRNLVGIALNLIETSAGGRIVFHQPQTRSRLGGSKIPSAPQVGGSRRGDCRDGLEDHLP